jgi:hypothetical protein
MSAVAILEEARTLGVSLRVEGGRIKAKGPRPAVEQLLPTLRRHKPELLEALAMVERPDPNETSGHWLILQPSQHIEQYFTPDTTRAELSRRYPGAAFIALADTTEPPPKV